MSAESASDRLGRLLTMVPWLMNRQGIDLESAAAEFGVSQDQVVDDLQLLFVCGTPGHMPDDLIEASWESGRVHVGNADTIARPLRLGRDEALALIVALRAMAAVPGIGRHDAIDRALVKLESAAGDAAIDTSQITVDLAAGAAEERHLPTVRAALDAGHRLRLEYLVAARDESTTRDVDPIRVVAVDGRWYLQAWCHRAEDVRTFRIDRISDASVLDVQAQPPAGVQLRPVPPRVFQPSEDDLTVGLVLQPHASWVAENFPLESSTRQQDGSLEVTLKVADPAWIVRLVWRLGGAARVTEPIWLAERVAADAAAALGAGERS